VTPLLRASHFLPAMTVTVIATALAVSTGRGVGAVAVAAAVGTGQLAVGWSNDYIDRDRDRVVGRRDKPIVAGQVSADAVRAAALVAVVACVPLSFLSGWRSALLHLSAVAVALAYNARLKSTIIRCRRGGRPSPRRCSGSVRTSSTPLPISMTTCASVCAACRNDSGGTPRWASACS
jgi:hypothetical protein